MPKAIKYKDNTYLDSTSVSYRRSPLQDTLDKIPYSQHLQTEIKRTSNSLIDTRNTNNLPSYYRWLGAGVYREFKDGNAIGTGVAQFGLLETIVYWVDTSGGPLIQYFKCANGDYKRTGYSGDNGWNGWTKIA